MNGCSRVRASSWGYDQDPAGFVCETFEHASCTAPVKTLIK